MFQLTNPDLTPQMDNINHVTEVAVAAIEDMEDIVGDQVSDAAAPDTTATAMEQVASPSTLITSRSALPVFATVLWAIQKDNVCDFDLNMIEKYAFLFKKRNENFVKEEEIIILKGLIGIKNSMLKVHKVLINLKYIQWKNVPPSPLEKGASRILNPLSYGRKYSNNQ